MYYEDNEGVIKLGDVVTVELDMKEGTLSFRVNGKDLGIAYEDELFRTRNCYPVVAFSSD